MSRKAVRPRNQNLRVETLEDRTVPANTPPIRSGWAFAGPQFTDNGASVLVPANPGIAAGKFHTLTIANAQIQWRATPAGTATQQSLASFFGAPAGTIMTSPRVVHDPYADRYLAAVIANHVGNGTSQLFLAVSDNQDPNGTWYFKSVPLTNSVTGGASFGQYLGLAVDEEAVYLTSSQYSAATGGTYRDARVVVLDKVAGAGGGWYGGGTLTVVGTFDPDTNAANDARYEGLVPAQMYNNPTAPGAAVGTYFVAYNGLGSGVAGNESVQLVRIDNPLTTPTFTASQIDVGDIDDTSSALPAATQPGSEGIGLDLGPRRLGNAVWRDDRLYFGSTVRTGAGLAAAHWFQLRTTDNTILQQANVNTAPVAAGLHAYHPSVAVDALGDVAVAFSASNPSNQVRGYYAARTPNPAVDPLNTLRDPALLPNQESGNEYVRRVGGVNAWGLYTGLTVAANDRVFWGFNAFAITKDTAATAPDQGRWATTAGAFAFNWPPDVASPIASFSVDEDAPSIPPVPLDSHFTDLEDLTGDKLTYAIVGNDNPGLVQAFLSADGHSIEFTLTPNANGFAFITVQATDKGTADAAPASTTTSFILTVRPVNDAPTAVADSYETDEDVRLDVSFPGVLSNDTDIDGDALQVDTASTIPPANALSFTLRPNGSFTYIPNGNFFGTDTFSYRARDAGGALSPLPPTTVTITVHPVNDAPTAQDDLFTTPEDVPLVRPAPGVKENDSDIDSPNFTVQLDQGPTRGDVILNPDGSFTYTPDADYNGPDSFTYTATDGQATSAPVTVTVNVTPVDDAPRPQNDTYFAAEGGVLNVPAASGVLVNDLEVDGQPLTILGNTTPANGTLQFNTADGSFTYTPTANFSGTDTFTYTVTDGTTPVDATVTINVGPVDDPPVAVGDAYSTAEDTTLNVPAPGVLANDTDIDSPTLTAELVTPPTQAAAFALNADGSFSYTPTLNFFGTDAFTYRARDATGASNVVTVTLKVTPVQDPVTANDDGPIAVAGQPVRINVLANDTDPDRDVLRVQSYSAPGKGRITRSGNALIYTPKPGASGPDSFTYVVTDQRGHTDTATVSLNLTDVTAPKVTAVRLGFGNRQANLFGLTRSVLPWTGITTVSVVFSEDVVVNPTALTIGVTGGDLPTTFTYDAATRTGTWTLASAFTGIGRMTLRLAAAGVADLSGNGLARDWSRTIGILPGDFDGNRVVNDADIRALKKLLNKVSYFGDLDGSGIVDQADVTIATNNKGKRLL